MTVPSVSHLRAAHLHDGHGTEEKRVAGVIFTPTFCVFFALVLPLLRSVFCLLSLSHGRGVTLSDHFRGILQAGGGEPRWPLSFCVFLVHIISALDFSCCFS